MKKAEVVKIYAKALRKDKLKSCLLAVCSGVITGLMYKIGASAGVNATCQKLAETFPEDAYTDEAIEKDIK